MFEAALIDKLKNDTLLVAYLAGFGTEPAIFSEFAPEKAVFPYIVFRIDTNATDFMGVHAFNVMVDYFDYNISRANSRKAVERIEYVLDNTILQSERLDTIRLSFFAGSPVPEPDPRSVHYNLQFSARAGRKKWMSQII
jgi:hypothetical protein